MNLNNSLRNDFVFFLFLFLLKLGCCIFAQLPLNNLKRNIKVIIHQQHSCGTQVSMTEIPKMFKV